MAPSHWGSAKTYQFSKREDPSQHLVMGWLEAQSPRWQLVKYTNKPFSGEDWKWVSLSAPSAPSSRGTISQGISLCLPQLCWTCEHKPYWPPDPGCQGIFIPWAAAAKAGVTDVYTSCFREILVIWRETEGKHEDGTCRPPWSLGKIAVCPYTCVGSEAWLSDCSF